MASATTTTSTDREANIMSNEQAHSVEEEGVVDDKVVKPAGCCRVLQSFMGDRATCIAMGVMCASAFV